MPDPGSTARRISVLPGRDRVREYTDEEEAQLVRNLSLVTYSLRSGELSSRPAAPALLSDIHRGIFQGVRDHAGRMRSANWGAEHLSFGPHRSLHRQEVSAAVTEIFNDISKSLRTFRENQEHPHYEQKAIHLAVWAHSTIIRIHPFEDGNGRSSRLLLEWILMATGLPPVATEVPRDEYLNCLNHFYTKNDLQPLIDLYLGILDRSLPVT
jgi:fido (protein-threonine AMPylation protein)